MISFNIHLTFLTTLQNKCIILILQVRKIKYRKVKNLAQRYRESS